MIDTTTPAGARAERRLRAEQIIWLTTVGSSGQPQASPVWFLWDGREFLIYSRPNQKVRSIERHPKVALHLNDDGTGSDIVTLEGEARIDAAAPPAHEHTAYLDKYRDGISRIGSTPERFAADFRVAIRVTPTRTRVW